ncbi:DUF624 domain-containing protein [Microbacterium sp. W1N]|uniref:YesL family protein n=1 Tax=Microbacterium festucae TaxID=2977531 RepID=UPI0021BFC8D0|nr:DUF624 domain-containing protein [Microbacterium festucae]MCT9821289.1 DUF624 domain-containing protein [Microbacterium festucae]
MQINVYGRTYGGLSAFIAFVALNLMYIVTCIPLVTIPAATSALYEVTIRYSDDESGRPVADYFPALVRNFPRATLLGLSLLIPFVLLAFSTAFWAASPEPLAIGAVIVSAAGALYFFAAFLHAMALTAKFRNSFRQTLKNALLLPAAEPVRTFGILIIPATVFAITVLFPVFWVIVVTIAFSVGAYATAFLFRSVYARYDAAVVDEDITGAERE